MLPNNNKKKEICLSLYFSRTNNFLCAAGVKICQLKSKDSKTNQYPLCLGNIWKNFTGNSIKKSELNEYVYGFSVYFDAIDFSDTWNIHI